MKSIAIDVRRDDIRQVRTVEAGFPELDDGQIRLAIRRFAITANNVTYAATGDVLGYWRFYPSAGAADGWGRVPVWGTAEVVENRNAHLAVGETVYGFFPMASHVTLQPSDVSALRFRDGAPHRQPLPAIYNDYARLTAVPDYDPQMDDLRCVLQPLLATSFLLADFLRDNACFGASAIVVGSASSKTALGLVHELVNSSSLAGLAGAGDRPRVIGLTSARNADFVSRYSGCDTTVVYEDIASLPSSEDAVFVDMAGNAEVRNAVHTHYGDRLRYSCAVGTSHWEKSGGLKEIAGTRAKFFFAPKQALKRREDWGGRELQRRIDQSWQGFARSSSDWFKIIYGEGADAASAFYLAALEGRARPSEGYVASLAAVG